MLVDIGFACWIDPSSKFEVHIFFHYFIVPFKHKNHSSSLAFMYLHQFCLQHISNMETMSILTEKTSKDISRGLVDPKILRVVSAFVCEGVFDQGSRDVTSPTDWVRVFFPDENKRIFS